MGIKRNEQFAAYFCSLMQEKEPNANQREAAERLGISQSAFSKILGGSMIPSVEMSKKIADVWNVPDFVKRANKARREDATKILSKQDEAECDEKICCATKPRLPITAAAGVLSEYLNGVLANECDFVPVIRTIPDYDFTMIVKGDSMEPKFEGGDEIALKKVDTFVEWGKTYVLETREGAVLKRLYKEKNGVRCVSYNHDEYPDFIVNESDILGVYKVVGLIRI